MITFETFKDFLVRLLFGWSFYLSVLFAHFASSQARFPYIKNHRTFFYLYSQHYTFRHHLTLLHAFISLEDMSIQIASSDLVSADIKKGPSAKVVEISSTTNL